jgi:hypothetical protein
MSNRKLHVWLLNSFRCDACGLLRDDLVQAISNNTPYIPCGGFMMFSCCGGKGTATWDNQAQQWKCKDCGSIQSNDSSYIGNGFTNEIKPWSSNKVKKCTCGAAKTSNPNCHSDWCDAK